MEAIVDGSIYSCPSLLASFSVVCFADLKKYKFTYHFGFPAIHSETSWKITSGTNSQSIEDLDSNSHDSSPTHLTSDETTALVDCVQTWRYSVDARQYGFFLAKKIRNSWGHHSGHHIHSDNENHTEDQNQLRPVTPGTPGTPGQSLGFTWVIGSLSSYEEGFFNGVDNMDCFVCFADPSTYPDYPGWMLRNLLVLIHKRWKLDNVQIMCYREIQSRRHEPRSLILSLALEQQKDSETPAASKGRKDETLPSNLPRITGWERNAAGKMASKIANLGEYMDPQR